jgi:hypothetical protein
MPVAGAVRITEFLASNLRGLTDEDNNHEDWIEIFNDGTNAVPLAGWSLTDKASDLTKWRFPTTNIGPGSFMVVFASNKDRRTPGKPLHTNFKLDADGEYLALVQPDGVTIATRFSPTYPPQGTDVTYGFPSDTVKTAMAKGAAVAWKVWTNGTQFTNESAGWNTSLAYSTAGWSNGTSGLGWDDSAAGVDYTPYFGTNASPRSLMSGTSRALFARFLPKLTNVTTAVELRLRMKFDDGFMAWLNGTLVASNLAPANPTWNSLSGGNRDDTLNAAWAVFSLPLSMAVEGTNLLAMQGFNTTTSSSDLLLLPELDLVFSQPSTQATYLASATPGLTNSGLATAVPPLVEALSTPERPIGGAGSPSITVTSLVTSVLAPVTNVTLYYRTMFNAEVAVPMVPATGGVCTATIPTTGLSAGEMLRWRIEACDASNNVGTGPLFLVANDDDRYYGTVAQNPAETNSRLPMLHWFLNNYTNAITEAGGYASFFYLGRFYDNILVKLHGQTTTGFPKKSQDLDFNSNHRFTWREGENDAKDVNFLTNWADKSKVRNTLAYEMFNRSGVCSHWAFPVRVQTNGQFYGIFDLVEDGDDRFIERVGLDPNGALYKVAYSAWATGGATSTNMWAYEKKSRKWEGTADFAAFCAGVATNWTLAQRRLYLYDNVDVAATINYLAALVVISCQDQGHKNFYLYRDSDGTREWRTLPWDVDLTLGHDYNRPTGTGYFGDVIMTDQVLQLGIVNNLKYIIFESPELNAMFLRRVRTLMDTVLQPLATPSGSLTNEARIRALLDQMDPPEVGVSDADLDWQKWGGWIQGGGASTSITNMMRPQAQRILDQFYPGRRSFLENSNQLSSGAAIPSSQPTNCSLTVEVGDFNPAGGRQDQEYVVLRNSSGFAVDVSGWKLSSAIDYTFPPGTVIPNSGGSNNIGALFVAKSPYAFRQRSGTPGSNQFCLVSGPYSGQLSARGETLLLENLAGQTVASTNYAGAPSLAQQFLRITELMYNPDPRTGSAADAQEFEFLELKNISTTQSLDLNGVSFSAGIGFAFTNTTLLGPGQRLILARNPAAFTSRYGSGFLLAGPYDGYLDNGGERLTLLDTNNEEILDFTYNNAWYPITDGLGFSLVVVDELAEPDAWDSRSNWRASGTLNGSPGAGDSLPAAAPVKINEALTHTDLPQVDSIELFNPTTDAVAIGGWFLTDDFYTPKKYRIPNGTTLPPLGYAVFDENHFNNQANATNNFALSSTGDDVWLFSGDAATNLTGYVHGFSFGAAANGISFGRHVTSTGEEHFVTQRTLTLGTNNSGPLVGPVVIRAIQYHPPDVVSNGIAIDDSGNEFVELLNISATNAPLFSLVAPTNSWRLGGAVAYSFPSNVTLAAGSSLMVVPFNPASNVLAAAFRTKWALSTNLPLFGPWTGKLDNSADDVQLQRPDTPNADGTVPFILVDRVRYTDSAPWPAAADGFGAALQRLTNGAYADDPANWTALPPFGAVMPDTDGDTIADWWEVAHGLNRFINDAALDPDGDGLSNAQEFRLRTDPYNAASALRLTAQPISAADIALSFEAQAQVSYLIQTNNSVAPSGWQTWRLVEAAPTNRVILLTNPATPVPAVFYRVLVP